MKCLRFGVFRGALPLEPFALSAAPDFVEGIFDLAPGWRLGSVMPLALL